MHVGHFAVGLLAKRVEPQVSLGTFMLAALLVDLLWCVFMIAGLEHVRFGTGLGAANYADAYDIALSHSLIMNAVWAAALSSAYLLWRRYLRGAVVLFIVVLTHWVLDAIAHRPDMPLAPGVSKYFGLGLWTNIPATIFFEGGLWLIAIVLYARSTYPRSLWGRFFFWAAILLFTLLWYNNIAGPPPPNPNTAPIASFIYFSLVVAWAYWMNRLRPYKV